MRMRRECSIFDAEYTARLYCAQRRSKKVNANAENPRILQLYAREVDAKNTLRVAARTNGQEVVQC